MVVELLLKYARCVQIQIFLRGLRYEASEYLVARTRPNTFAALTDDPLENVATFQPRTVKPTAPHDETRRIAEERGFTARTTQAPSPKVDGRSLRSRGRTGQLNISVKPETKDAFWRFASAHGYEAGEDALLALLDLATPQD